MECSQCPCSQSLGLTRQFGFQNLLCVSMETVSMRLMRTFINIYIYISTCTYTNISQIIAFVCLFVSCNVLGPFADSLAAPAMRVQSEWTDDYAGDFGACCVHWRLKQIYKNLEQVGEKSIKSKKLRKKRQTKKYWKSHESRRGSLCWQERPEVICYSSSEHATLGENKPVEEEMKQTFSDK